MPEYRFLLANGKTLVLEGSQPPTHEQAQQEAQAEGMQLAPATGPEMASAQPQNAPEEHREAMGAQPPTGASEAAEGESKGGLIAANYALKKAGDYLPAIVHKAGTMMHEGSGAIAKGLGRAAGAFTGGGLGWTLGNALGGPAGGGVGGIAGYNLGGRMGRKVGSTLVGGQKAIGKVLQIAGESGYPEEIYAGLGAKTLARKGMQGLAKGLPYVGQVLTAADVAKTLYDGTRDSAKLQGNINKSISGLEDNYQEEKLLRLLAEAEARKK